MRTSTEPARDDDGGAAARIRVDAHARARVRVDRHVLRVDAGHGCLVVADHREHDGAFLERDRRDVVVRALLRVERNELDGGAAADVEDVAVGQGDLGAARIVRAHLVAGGDRQVAAGLDRAVQAGDDRDLAGRLAHVRVGAPALRLTQSGAKPPGQPTPPQGQFAERSSLSPAPCRERAACHRSRLARRGRICSK